MASKYTISMENQTIVADATLIILRAAAAISSRASLLEIERITVSQQGTATPQQLGVILAQKASAFGTYTSTTPSPHVIGGGVQRVGSSGENCGARLRISRTYPMPHRSLAGWLSGRVRAILLPLLASENANSRD